MVSQTKVNLGEPPGTLKMIKQIANFGNRILDLDGNLVLLFIVYTHSESTIFLAHEQDRSTQRRYTGFDETFI